MACDKDGMFYGTWWVKPKLCTKNKVRPENPDKNKSYYPIEPNLPFFLKQD